MARANRHHLPGYVWHITHRCHKREFLLKFDKDKRRWIHWLFEAKKRFGLMILNFTVTSNHIHLLVKDTRETAISKSMQLIAGRTAQEYNLRKNRNGAYWEDRYHATAIANDNHLIQCLVYIDLNMVRAGAVSHPIDWLHSGYCEIQYPSQRYTIIDKNVLMALTDFKELSDFQNAQRDWINTAIINGPTIRDALWSESIAVGGLGYVESIQMELGVCAKTRQCIDGGDKYSLRESAVSYSVDLGIKKGRLSQ
ncbi:MAG: transposase [Anaerolineae bacterium]|nr:transposase [Anaerolineae bacterium]